MKQDIKKLKHAWTNLDTTLLEVLCVIKTKKQYRAARMVLNEIIDVVGENQKHPLVSLLDTLGVLIDNYETVHFPEPNSDPVSKLKFLMEENDLTQIDLFEIGSQGVVSEILNGKRELNKRQIMALSRLFNVSPLVFFERPKVQQAA